MTLRVVRRNGPPANVSDLDTLRELYEAGAVAWDDKVSEDGGPLVDIGWALGLKRPPLPAATPSIRERLLVNRIASGLSVGLCVLVLLGFAWIVRGCDPNRTKVEVVRVRLVPYTSPAGMPMQMLLVDWKNIGKTTVRGVVADIVTLDARGNRLDSSSSPQWIYADEQGIRPGETYREPDDAGYIVAPDATEQEAIRMLSGEAGVRASIMAADAHVRIVRAEESSEVR